MAASIKVGPSASDVHQFLRCLLSILSCNLLPASELQSLTHRCHLAGVRSLNLPSLWCFCYFLFLLSFSSALLELFHLSDVVSTTRRIDRMVLRCPALSPDLLAQLAFFEQYAAAAYCPDNNIPSSSNVVFCSAGNCPLVQGAGAITVAEFHEYIWLLHTK